MDEEQDVTIKPATPTKNIGGRPLGSVETPYSMLKLDLSQTLKLQKDIRNLVWDQVEEIKKKLKQDVPIKERLECVELLGNIMGKLTGNVQQTSKLVFNELKEADGSSDSAIAGFDELLGGGGKR